MRNDRGADVIRVPRPSTPASYHLTMKTLALIIATARNNTAPGIRSGIYLAIGSTLIAAHQMERPRRLIELSPGYVAVTPQRYHDANGDTPPGRSTHEHQSQPADH